MQTRQPHSRRSERGASPGLFIFILLVVIAIGYVSNITGPAAGWVDRLKNRQAATEAAEEPADQGSATAAAPTASLPAEALLDEDFTDQEFVAKAPLKPDAEESEYDRLYQQYLAKLKGPKVGDTVTLLMANNRDTVKGEILELTAAAVRLKIEYGKVLYTAQAISPKHRSKLFVERTAKILAARELTRRQQAEREAQSKPQLVDSPTAQQPTGTVAMRTPSKPPKPNLPPASGKLAYNTSPATTPGHLRPSLEAIANWIQTQQRRMGGKLATRMFAKQPDRANAVLYIYMHQNFTGQDYQWRYQVTEGIWRIWALRAVDAGVVPGPSNGHIVLVGPQGKIIGGSTPTEGSELWAQEKL